MMAARSSSSPLRDTEANIDFIRPGIDLSAVEGAPVGTTLEQQKERRDQIFVTHKVQIVDARRGSGGRTTGPADGTTTTGAPGEQGDEVAGDDREFLSSWDFDTNGFTLLTPLPVLTVDPKDRPKTRQTYLPELVELARRKAGAEKAYSFNYFYRDDARGREYGAMYVRYAHSDYGPGSPETLRWMLTDHFKVPPEELENTELCVANVWHPLDHPAWNDPLCLLDAASLGPSGGYPVPERKIPLVIDSIATGIRDEERAGMKRFYKTGFFTRFNSGESNDSLVVSAPPYAPTHRWVYLPDMPPDHAWLFKQYDEREGVAKCAFHNSFSDPVNAQDTTKPGRRSLECRIVLTFPKQRGDGARSSAKL